MNYMKKLIFILFSGWLLPVAVSGQTPDCSKFREGKFRTADTRIGAIVVTERNAVYQTETTASLKLVIRFRISWLDNCTCTLKLDKVIQNENKQDIPGNLTVTLKIIETYSGSYLQEISSSLTNGVYRTIVNKTE